MPVEEATSNNARNELQNKYLFHQINEEHHPLLHLQEVPVKLNL